MPDLSKALLLIGIIGQSVLVIGCGTACAWTGQEAAVDVVYVSVVSALSTLNGDLGLTHRVSRCEHGESTYVDWGGCEM